jgi:hypothetical protein
VLADFGRPERLAETSEMNNEIGRGDDCPALVGSNPRVDIPVERRFVERPIVGNLRTDLDPRTEPVLPDERIPSRDADALPLRIVEILGAEGKVFNCSANS